jgi:hypothetical protein
MVESPLGPVNALVQSQTVARSPLALGSTPAGPTTVDRNRRVRLGLHRREPVHPLKRAGSGPKWARISLLLDSLISHI